MWNSSKRPRRLALLSVASAVLATFLSGPGIAQPQLTTIQDTLYKADGTRFSGLLIVSWNSFETGNLSNIVAQTLTVKVVDGNFRVQLVPTTDSVPPRFYNVKYNSDGKIQFEELWSVGPASSPLRIRDVRVSASPSPGPLQPPSQTPIQETDVVGLTGDLGLRPIKGPGFSAGRAALINSSGAVEAVVGNPLDCVLVDGTSGPCGAGGALFVEAETPAGVIDGSNATFTLANAPSQPSSLSLFRNGVLEQLGSDYTLTGSTVQFLAGAIPQLGDTLMAGYRLASGAAPLVGPQIGGVPEIICSAAGTATSSTNFTSLGTCAIGAHVLQTGDRVEIHFDLAHQGAATGFEFKALWGQTVLMDRVGVAAESMIAGKGEAGVYNGGAQLRAESWGTTLAFAAGMVNATDSMVPALTINFWVKMEQSTSETVTLRNFTVVRYPAQ